MTAPSKQSHRKASSISEQKKVFDAQWIRFFAGGLASATAEIFTLPIDCIKVRLQAWRSATKSTIPIHMINYATLKTKTISALDVPYKGMMDVASKIISEEGPTALWKGSTPALMRQISYTSSCMVLYEPFRDFFRTNVGNRSEIPFINKFLAGGCAGAIGISIANPVDVIKVRMQADRSGQLYRSLGDAFKKIYTHEGYKGFFRGMSPNIQRGFIVNAAELGTYDHCKQFFLTSGLLPDGVFSHFGASLVAGFAGAASSNPLDVMKTRLMSQPIGSNGKGTLYSSVLDCARKTYNEAGMIAFYKGFIPNWMRKAPWCVIFFISYEKYRASMSIY